MQVAVVVPVKAFGDAKVRLAPALTPGERAALARSMATLVVRAAAPMPVIVVCDDEGVRDWATSVGAQPHWTPGLGLDGAVEAGVELARSQGAARVVVAHADLPLATALDHVVGTAGVAIVADRHHDGTNVISIPTDAGFRFHYGPASCQHHQREAQRLGLAVELVEDDGLAWDVDLPADLQVPGGIDLLAGLR